MIFTIIIHSILVERHINRIFFRKYIKLLYNNKNIHQCGVWSGHRIQNTNILVVCTTVLPDLNHLLINKATSFGKDMNINTN